METTLIIYLAGLLALSIGIIIFLVFFLRNYIKKVVLKSKRLDRRYVLKSDFQHYMSQKNQPFTLSNRDKTFIIDEVMQCIRLNEKEEQQKKKDLLEESLKKNPIQKPVVKFPPPITKSGFPNNLSETQGDSYFRFFNFQGDNAEFEFCGANVERAKANMTELEQACEISGSISAADRIENVGKGTVYLRNGKWEVISKAKIKFI